LLLLGCTEDTDLPTQPVPFVQRPLGVDPSEGPDLTSEQVALIPDLRDVPRRVKLGNDLRYVVELHNETDEGISLDPCPAFYQAWGESSVAYFGPGFLNCKAAPDVVPAGEAVPFEMVLELPDNFDGQDSFTGTIVWYLGHSGSSSEAAFSKPITVSK
jgi:hypothetical protein